MNPSDLIKAYSSDPIAHYEMKDFTVSETQENSICGDSLTVFLKLSESGEVIAYSHSGKPQMFTLAAASMLAEVIVGNSVETVLEWGGEYMKYELGLDVSPRRQRSTVTALLAIHNAIHQWKGVQKTETYEEIMEY